MIGVLISPGNTMNVLHIDSSLLGAMRLQIMGIERFDVVRAEGVNRSAESKAAELASARTAISALFADAGVEAA
ncbi:hypothetical protein BH10PSE18_BH10PSE18_39600 [soil metagenome]